MNFLMPHAWPMISVSGHLFGLLLSCMGVFVQFLYCFHLNAGGRRRTAWVVTSGGLAFVNNFIGPPLFSGQEKSGVDANLSAMAGI